MKSAQRKGLLKVKDLLEEGILSKEEKVLKAGGFWKEAKMIKTFSMEVCTKE